VALVACSLALLVALAAPAGAHVDLEPTTAVAGSTATLTFRFRHGKDGTATTGLEVQVPEGASVEEVPPVAGWTSSVSADGSVVTWSGGAVPDGVEAAFPLVVRLPDEAGVVLFPTIQATEAGELAWISEDEGEEEGEAAQPAPRLELTPGPGSTGSSTTQPAPSSTTASTRDLPRTALEADQRDDGGGSLLPWVVGSGVAAVVAIGVGGTVLRRRAG
jgi:uncharacterized protein YcnI